jgi:hypothetical protein
MSVNGFEVIPNAKRLISSLRDMGYEFEAAVADLIDNSIEARATTVWIDVEWGWGGESAYVSIADNGLGMSPHELREALRFGSERDYEDEDLGKFGLGLKTASLSQCMKFTVATRQNPNRADIAAYCWDVEHVVATNRWEILQVKTTDLHENTRRHLKETTGTVVIWERLDRILGYNKPEGESARKRLNAMCRVLEDHLAMVFHRFLMGEVRGKRLAIYINGNKVQPWDPFARSEPNTKKLDAGSFRVEGIKGKGDVVVEPYVLPAQSRFSSPESWNRASGPEKWNKQQGFYIYRADRMIQSGGWNGIRALDEHRKLSRIAISFNPRLDDEFKINVPKMRVSLPAAIRDAVTRFVATGVTMAEDEYRQRESKGSASPPPAPAPKGNPQPISGASAQPATIAAQGSGASSTSVPVGRQSGVSSPGLGWVPDDAPVTRHDVERVGAHLRRIAKPDEMPTLDSVLARSASMFSS